MSKSCWIEQLKIYFGLQDILKEQIHWLGFEVGIEISLIPNTKSGRKLVGIEF